MPQTKTFAPSKSLNTPQSKHYHELIEQITPGGVNSPFRSFAEVGGHAIFFEQAKGSRLIDIDGNEYIDYLGAWGPAILGHSPDNVVNACQNILAKGAVFGTPHTLELEFGQLLLEAIPSMEMVRFVNSGTEAVMSAVRLARGYTEKDVIVMFEGGYHGHKRQRFGIKRASQQWWYPSRHCRKYSDGKIQRPRFIRGDIAATQRQSCCCSN